MKPIYTVILSLAVSIILGIAIIGTGLGIAILAEKDKYPATELKTVQKTLSFNADCNTLNASVFNIKYTIKDTTVFKVNIKAPKAALKYIIVKQNNQTLYIQKKNGMPNKLNKNISISIVGPALPTITASAGSEIKAEGNYNSNLNANVSSGAIVSIKKHSGTLCKLVGSSGAVINIKQTAANTLVANASSGCAIEIGKNKTAQCASFTASSGANIDASNFVANEGTAIASSGAVIECNVQKLTTQQSSGGAIENIQK